MTEFGPVHHTDPLAGPSVPVVLDTGTEFVGCLLQSEPAQAAALLELVADEDLAAPLDQQALALIRPLVARGIAPNVAAVLAHARTTGVAVGEHAQQRLTHHLLDAYQGSAGPTNGRYIAAAVIEQAYRRAGTEYATRVTQAADESALDVFEQVLADRERLRDLWRRHRLAEGTPAVQEVGAA